MFDGVVRTLTNVRHIPNLRRGLISLGFDTLGCDVSTMYGTMNIKDGVSTIIKGDKVKKNFTFIMEPVVGRAKTQEFSICCEEVGESEDF